MKSFQKIGMTLACVTLMWGCTEPATTPEPTPDMGQQMVEEAPVIGLIIRRLKAGQDVDGFKAARDAYVAKFEAESGITVDREFEALVDFSTSMPPDPTVFVGITRGESLAQFSAGADAAGATAEAAAYFPTFDVEHFSLLQPVGGGEFDLAGIAAQGSGYVLEVATRDLSAYEGFDASAYEGARDAFVTFLSDQPGVVAEYQWVSPADPNIAVGMTVYESFEAWGAIWSSDAFFSAPEYGAFIGAYPPGGGFLSAPTK